MKGKTKNKFDARNLWWTKLWHDLNPQPRKDLLKVGRAKFQTKEEARSLLLSSSASQPQQEDEDDDDERKKS